MLRVLEKPCENCADIKLRLNMCTLKNRERLNMRDISKHEFKTKKSFQFLQALDAFAVSREREELEKQSKLVYYELYQTEKLV